MKDQQKNINRGEALAKAIQQSELSKTVIAKKAGYNRTSLYNHIRTPDLSFDILEKYGKALAYDFTRVFPEMIRYIAFEDPKAEYRETLTFDIVLKQRDQWRDKYYDLLEKYNKLIEDKLELGK